MRKIFLTALFLFGLAAVSGQALAVSFRFIIPPPPATPALSDITNSSAVAGSESFSVYANISGAVQQKTCCGANCERTDCDMSEWWLATDNSISPNPPCIPNANGMPGMSDSICKIAGAPNPMLFYYKEGEIADTNSVPMTYDASTGRFKGTISLDGFVEDDAIYYYIVAADSRGNVVSMLPDSSKTPCTSLASWDANYETPAFDNCGVASGYEQCKRNVAFNPICFSSDYSVNDREGDTCSEPAANGVQVPIIGQANSDFLGFSAGAGKGFVDLPTDDVVCAKIRLKGGPPITSSGPIESYQMTFFNPDIPDPNPADYYFPNSFAITYAPEASGADKNLVNVLWDGECLTNPNTIDTLECKIVVGNEDESKLKIGFDTNLHHLKFIAKNAVTTKTGSKTILGNASNRLGMKFQTGEINLSGSMVFWTVDQSSELTMMKETKLVILSAGISDPAPPIIGQTTCKTNGFGSNPFCVKNETNPIGDNECVIDFFPSPDATGVDKYKVYVGATDNRAEAVYDPSLDITENGSLQYSISKNVPISNLNGQTLYFFMSSYTATNSAETHLNERAGTSCRVEDWAPPLQPTGLSCATPDGSEKRCLCNWVADPNDPTIYGYNIKRTGVTLPLNSATILGTSFTDTSSALVNGTSYTYQLQAVDIGGNESGWTDAVCVPQDLKPPAQVDTLGITLQSGSPIGFNFTWEPNVEPDMLNYNLYTCKREIEGVDCENKSQYTKLTTIAQSNPPDLLRYSNNTAFGFGPEWDCFYVEACDNCKVSPQTCPNKPGTEPNCSTFSTMASYRHCLIIEIPPELNAPLWPTPQNDGKEIKITPEPEGNKCKLEWNKICEGESNPPEPEGTFEDCNFPEALQLMGYKVARREAVDGDCATTNVPEPSDTNPEIGSAGISANPSFTDGKKLGNGTYDLTNGTKYCYRVYGYDAAGLISRALPVPAPVECTPQDTLPPAKPVVSEEHGSGLCMPKWNAVVDKNTPVYSVYRCVGDFSVCDTAAEFTAIDDPAAVNTSILYFEDGTVTDGMTYTYCVTAKDNSGNVSVKFEAADKTNCVECMAGDLCQAPISISAVEYGSDRGAKVSYEKSPADDSAPYEAGEGYKIYLCGPGATTPCSLKTPDCKSNPLQEYGTELTYRNLGTPAAGNYYFGVTYTGPESGCMESKMTMSNAIHVSTIYYADPCLPFDNCDLTIDFGTSVFKKYSLATCTTGADCKNGAFKKVETPLAGLTVQVVDVTSPGTVVSVNSFCDDGVVSPFHVPEGTTGHTYKVIARIPLAGVDSFFKVKLCKEITATECIVELKTGLDLKSATTAIVSLNAVEIPDASSGAGGGEMGNPNCDGVVNIADLGALKKAFGAGKVAPYPMCYRPWADFNMDGIVGLSDLAVVKKNFNKVIADSSQLTGGKIPDASLCSAKYDPLPACCPKSCAQ
ncbi:MAG: hypothetical protein WCX65_00380 [bacterium]